MADICVKCGQPTGNPKFDLCSKCFHDNKKPPAVAATVVDVKSKDKDEKPAPVPKPRKKLLHVCEVRVIGSDGKYCLHIQAIGTDGLGFKCKVVVSEKGGSKNNSKTGIILSDDGVTPCYSREFSTGRDGFLIVNLRSFTERTRYIVVEVRGTKKDKTIRLVGPKDKAVFSPEAGFFRNLFSS